MKYDIRAELLYKLIEKLKEYESYLIELIETNRELSDDSFEERVNIESEIASTEKQIEEQGSNPLELIKGITENCPELSMVNYSHDEVRILNDALIEIYQITHK